MPIQITISAETAEETMKLIQELADTVFKTQRVDVSPKTEVSTSETESTKQKTKPQPQKPKAQTTPDEPVPSIVELRAKAQEKGKTPEGKQAIKALLQKYGCKSISTVPEEKRAEFMAEVEAL
ncbi:hypothetical protein FB379_11759 [Aeribacillus composti]|uniref:hypothetical protein n=1 Tax=Aeribacillus composti TaxID=1868734 RepID=UPI0011996C9A|nr:hypothetical protein [Aeribacillus composti]TVZ81260.1 hypothetical protein FB379_11759 [Aeribacillus composti]